MFHFGILPVNRQGLPQGSDMERVQRDCENCGATRTTLHVPCPMETSLSMEETVSSHDDSGCKIRRLSP